MKLLSILMVALSFSFAHAADKIKMYFKNEEMMKIIEIYSKASGQKFVIDPAVRGKASILLQEPVSLEEAFNHLSSALALNGYAISKHGDTMIINSARHVQRDLIEISTEVPTLNPQRMYTWIYNAKYASVEEINREIRIFSSKDGEMSVNPRTNQLIFTDWTSNLIRIAEIIKQVDKQMDPATSQKK